MHLILGLGCLAWRWSACGTVEVLWKPKFALIVALSSFVWLGLVSLSGYFTVCTMHLEYMKVSLFELYFGRKLTFGQYSNFLRRSCKCEIHVHRHQGTNIREMRGRMLPQTPREVGRRTSVVANWYCCMLRCGFSVSCYSCGSALTAAQQCLVHLQEDMNKTMRPQNTHSKCKPTTCLK